MFGVLAGVKTISGVFATFSARFLPVAPTFQVSYHHTRIMIHTKKHNEEITRQSQKIIKSYTINFLSVFVFHNLIYWHGYLTTIHMRNK